MNTKIVSAFFIVVALSGTGWTDGLSIKKTLLASLNDTELKEQEENARHLRKGTFGGIPLIEDIELRLRNQAYDLERMRYTLRIQPRGFGETRAARNYEKLYSSNYEMKAHLARNLALRNRYIQILDQMEQWAVEEHYKELIEVYEDKIKVMEKKQYNVEEFDLNDLIEGEDDNTKVHNQIYELKRQFFPSRYSIESSLQDAAAAVDFDTAGFVNVDSVIAWVEQRDYAFDTNNAYLAYYRLQHEVAVARFSLEKAERKQYISLLSFSYDNGDWLEEYYDRNDPKKTVNYNNAFIVEVGIKIPDLTMARHDLVRRKADYLDEKEDYNQVKLELIAQMGKDKKDLFSFIAQYRFLRARENEVNATSSLKKYLQMSGVDPLILLSIRESIVKNHIEIARLKYRILRNYVQVVDVSGELSKPPLKNFLSQSRELLEP